MSAGESQQQASVATSSFAKGALAIGLLAAGISVVKYGVGVFPSWIFMFDMSLYWQSPGEAPLMEPPADYLMTNFVAAWTAGALGLSQPSSYFAFHVALAVFAIVLPFLMPRVRESMSRSWLVFILVVGGPITAILLTWANGYDAVTIIGLMIAALARSWPVMAIGWFLATINHITFGPFALLAWIPVFWLVMHAEGAAFRIRRIVIAIAAVAAGYLANNAITTAWGGSTDRISLYEQLFAESMMEKYWQGMPLTVFSVLGIGWVIVLLPTIRRTLVGKLLIVEGLAMGFLIPLMTHDATRAVGIVAFAAILAWAVTMGAPGTRDTSEPWMPFRIAAAIVPVPVVWDGTFLLGGWGNVVNLDVLLTPPDWYAPPTP